MDTRRASLLPLFDWKFHLALNGTSYFATFYMLKSPFECGQSQMVDCEDFWSNHMLLVALMNVSWHGTPGLLAIAILKRWTKTIFVMSAILLAWACLTFDAYIRGGFSMDGQNGCENCDYTAFFTIALSWLYFMIALLVGAATWPDRSNPEAS